MPKYPLSMRVLHWLIAVMIIGMLAAGLIMEDLSHDNPARGLVYSLHKSFGITILALVLIRIAVRLRGPVPTLPQAIPARERILAHAGHWALYGFMLAMPLSGYLMSTFYGRPVLWFGVPLPRLVGVRPDDGALARNFHSYAAYALIAMLVVHIGAVILHYVRQRVNLLTRMW
jgi:cytochrome b561